MSQRCPRPYFWSSGATSRIRAATPREQQMAVDGGDGSVSVKLSRKDQVTEKQMMERTVSDPASDPVTGADFGAGPGAGKTKAPI